MPAGPRPRLSRVKHLAVASLLQPVWRTGMREGAGMKITERLKAEHGVFLYQLDRLEELSLGDTPMDVLAAVVETIASAEDHHSMIEDQVLYPALVQANSGEFPLLRKARAEHVEIRRLVTRIRSGAFDELTVCAFVAL